MGSRSFSALPQSTRHQEHPTSPGADVAGVSPVLLQVWAESVQVQMWKCVDVLDCLAAHECVRARGRVRVRVQVSACVCAGVPVCAHTVTGVGMRTGVAGGSLAR
jgi:hypothetical protein